MHKNVIHTKAVRYDERPKMKKKKKKKSSPFPLNIWIRDHTYCISNCFQFPASLFCFFLFFSLTYPKFLRSTRNAGQKPFGIRISWSVVYFRMRYFKVQAEIWIHIIEEKVIRTFQSCISLEIMTLEIKKSFGKHKKPSDKRT